MELSIAAIIIGLILAFGSLAIQIGNVIDQGKEFVKGKQGLGRAILNVFLGQGLTMIAMAFGGLLVLLGLVGHFLL